jgi:hypothetical protein
MSADITATTPGRPRPRIDKHAGEARPYIVDLSPLLGGADLLAGAPDVVCASLPIGAAVVRSGRHVSVQIDASSMPDGRPYADHTMTISCATVRGARVACTITVRVHG